MRTDAFPALPTYSVWAFHLVDGKWVKDAQYCWTTTDPVKGLDYAKKVDAVSGWKTTTNCPAVIPASERAVNGGAMRGMENYKNLPVRVCDTLYASVDTPVCRPARQTVTLNLPPIAAPISA